MEKIEELYENLSGCYVQKVEIDNEVMGLIAFDGGHTLNFYNIDGENTDMRSVGDFSVYRTPLEEAKKDISEWIEEMQEELNLDEVE